MLLHGLCGSAEVWWSLARALHGWRLVALDQRGRGASDWAPDGDYSHEACLLDFVEFVERLGLDRFALLGHSAGGAVALAYALRHPEPVEKLVLEEIGPPTGQAQRGAQIRAQLAELPLAFPSWDAASAYHRVRNPKLSEQRLRASLPYFFRELPDGTITWKYDLAGLLRLDPAHDAGFDLWQDIGRVTCPILLMRGARSDVVADDALNTMSAANARLKWVDIPEAGHNVHMDNPSAFNRELSVFLNRP